VEGGELDGVEAYAGCLVGWLGFGIHDLRVFKVEEKGDRKGIEGRRNQSSQLPPHTRTVVSFPFARSIFKQSLEKSARYAVVAARGIVDAAVGGIEDGSLKLIA
jgi:hypothetical protein